MKKSVLTKTMFQGSYENEQTLSKLTAEIERKPSQIAFKANLREQERIYNSRVLNVEAFRIWVTALRSGKYLQKAWSYTANYEDKIVVLKYRKGELHFSALGVLCDVTKDITGGEWHGEWFVKQGRSFEDWTKDGNDNICLPPFVTKKLGIKNIESDLLPDIDDLARMNVELNFNELADIIEENYL